jgi:hypothetical protein
VGGLLGLKNGVPQSLLRNLQIRPQENHVSHHPVPSRTNAEAS